MMLFDPSRSANEAPPHKDALRLPHVFLLKLKGLLLPPPPSLSLSDSLPALYAGFSISILE